MVEKALTSGMQQVILHFRVGLPFQNLVRLLKTYKYKLCIFASLSLVFYWKR